MQLLILLLLLAAVDSGRLNEVKPLLKSIGGEEAEKAINEAEELTSVISAVQSFQQGLNGGSGNIQDIVNAFDNLARPDGTPDGDNNDGGVNFARPQNNVGVQNNASAQNNPRPQNNASAQNNVPSGKVNVNNSPVNFPLAPIMQIADEGITYSLAKYISDNNYQIPL